MKRELTRINESWDPDYDDKPVNQFGEKWQKISGTWLNSVIDHVIKDVQIDPFEDGPKIESLSLGSLHLCEDGHLIATIYGGANGGGFRGEQSNWKYYLSLVRKFLGKLLDYNNGQCFKDVWMIDWDNDCCDDVWTLRLGLELTDEEKLQLVECGFKVIDPTQLRIGLDAAMDMFTPYPMAQNVDCSNPYNESTRIDEMRRIMNEKWVPYTIMAELVKVSNAGEQRIKVDEVGSYEEAFEMLEDYILDSPDADDFVKEEYARFASGDDPHGLEKRLGWLEKNGQLHETFLDAKYSVELHVTEKENPNERLGDYLLDDDYFAESGVTSVKPNSDDRYLVDVMCVCPFCGETNKVTIKKSDWVLGCHRYDRGMPIQTAFPKLTPDERELLKTGICDKCWN